MYELSQDFTNQDYQIQSSFSQSTSLKEIDTQIIQEDSFSSIFKQKRRKSPLYYNLSSLFQINTSSTKKIILEAKNETSKISLITGIDQDIISEEDIAINMVEHDFIVRMSPKNRYKIRVRVKEVKRGEPRIVQTDES